MGVLRLVAAGPGSAHRQVPARDARRLPRGVAARGGLHRRPALEEVRPDRRGRDHCGRGPGHVARSRSRWRGCATDRGSWRRSWVPAPRSSCRPRSMPTERACPRRSGPHWRTSRRRPSAIPSDAPSSERPHLGPGPDKVFAAFCAAGLWPGLGKRTAAELPAAGIVSPDDVSADRLLKLPRVGRQRAERLFSSFLAAQPTYEVVGILVAAGLEARLAAGCRRRAGPDAARRLRDDPWALLGLPGVTLGDADRLAIAVLSGADRQDTRRGRAIVAMTLRTATRDGHTVPAGRPGGRGAAGRGDHRSGGRDRRRRRLRRRARARAADAGGPGLRARPGAPDAVPGPVRDGRGGGGRGHRPAGAAAGRIADPASVRSVAKGLDKAQQAAVAQVLPTASAC